MSRNRGELRDNERSWAIDLISQINQYINEENCSVIKYAGGEFSLSTGVGSLFPDIILFSDISKVTAIQGWELKYPDTDINDRDLIENAIKKAEILSLNSFLIWNVSLARLYVKDNNSNSFTLFKEWDDLKYLKNREDVAYNLGEVRNLLYKILDDINSYLRIGFIKSEKILESVASENMLKLILSNIDECAKSLNQASKIDIDFYDEVLLWWDSEKDTYPRKSNLWVEASKLAIISLMNKFIFSNILKKYNSNANKIEILKENSSISECLNVFKSISEECDFYNIFDEQSGEKYIDDTTLKLLNTFNRYLIDLDFLKYDDKNMENLLSKVISRGRRKIVGQFSTPKELAIFLTTISLKNKTDRVLDPCCGTGTIIKSVYEVKTNLGIDNEEALNTVWGGDKFRFPLQFAMLSLTSPENIGKQINIFKEDVFNLQPNETLEIHDVNSNKAINVKCGNFDTIVSNLPFVQQEDFYSLNQHALDFLRRVKGKFNSRSDLYAYILLKLKDILSKNGTIGVIVSNSWLGTEFGSTLYKLLLQDFSLKYIITSGKGRWFKNADIVTNILVLEDKNKENDTSFIVLRKSLEELISDNCTEEMISKASLISAKIRKKVESDSYIINTYKTHQIEKLESMGIIKNALFTDCLWLLEFNDFLVPLKKLFRIRRGERRGWNPLFYPKNHNIEKEYIIPVMKKLNTSSYRMDLNASIDGFCCNRSIEELKLKGDYGAINWIKKFENELNNTGVPLVECLPRKNMLWYEMPLKYAFDIGLLINPDKRLFFSRAETPVFFDQRLTGLIRRDMNYDLNILVALLNSILGLFYIEAIGFGRGLGVLDLNKNKVEECFKILNPELISENDKTKIIKKYAKLESREVYNIKQELEQSDRYEFDMLVLESFGLDTHYNNIRKSLLELYEIRKSVEHN